MTVSATRGGNRGANNANKLNQRPSNANTEATFEAKQAKVNMGSTRDKAAVEAQKRMLEIVGADDSLKNKEKNDVSGFAERTQEMVDGVYDLLKAYDMSKVECAKLIERHEHDEVAIQMAVFAQIEEREEQAKRGGFGEGDDEWTENLSKAEKKKR